MLSFLMEWLETILFVAAAVAGAILFAGLLGWLFEAHDAEELEHIPGDW